MDRRDRVINEAIDKLSELTKEDFHGYRSEIWCVLLRVYDQGGQSKDTSQPVKEYTPRQLAKRIKKTGETIILAKQTLGGLI